LPTEIERKFLVNHDGYKKEKIIDKINIEQGYLTLEKEKEKVIRIRITDDKAFLTLKGLATSITRHEFEYQIPLDEAREMLALFCHKPIIKKVRYKNKYQDNVWEIDEFTAENAVLTIAEIELESEGQEFNLPEFIDQEVTDDERYYNFNLVKNPYKSWSNKNF